MTHSGLPHENIPGRKLTVESLYASEISELWDLLEEYAKSSKKNTAPSLYDTTYHFATFEPPFTPPRAVRDTNSPVSEINVHVQRTSEDVEVQVSIDVNAMPDGFMFELTDAFGAEQYVQTVKNKVVDRSRTTSAELHEMLVGLALTRDEKIKLRLAKASGVEMLLGKLGPMSPLIEAGLSNNAQSVRNTNYYDFTVEDTDSDEFLEATVTHSTVRSPYGVNVLEDTESFVVDVTWVKQDGGVKKTGIASLEISQHVDPDTNVRNYSLANELGKIEVTDDDFSGSTYIEIQDISQILQTMLHAFITETSSGIVAARNLNQQP